MKKIMMIIALHFISNNVNAQKLKPVLNFSTAQEILNGSLEYASANKLNVAIAIYDTNGQLINFAKMDGVSAGSSKVSQWKGLSAALYQFSTEETAKWNVPNAPDIATVPGGILIISIENFVLGSIGVSGSSTTNDVKCAEAGLKKAGLVFDKKE
jgi:uncharacterized protein GlcG (DUF336 family)